MYNQKQISWRLVSKQISSVFLFVILFMTPSFVFASNWSIVPQYATSTIYQNTASFPLVINQRYQFSTGFINAKVSSTTNTNLNSNDFSAVCYQTSTNFCITQIIVPPQNYFTFVETGGSTGIVFVINSQMYLDNASSTILVTNPHEDLFYGFVVFFAIMCFVVWFFNISKRN